jgi:hypothetical protein
MEFKQAVEVRLLQDYDTSISPDAAHGKPVTAPFADGESAIALILQSNGAGTVQVIMQVLWISQLVMLHFIR